MKRASLGSIFVIHGAHGRFSVTYCLHHYLYSDLLARFTSASFCSRATPSDLTAIGRFKIHRQQISKYFCIISKRNDGILSLFINTDQNSVHYHSDDFSNENWSEIGRFRILPSFCPRTSLISQLNPDDSANPQLPISNHQTPMSKL